MLMLDPASILMLEVSRGLLLRFRTGNADLNLEDLIEIAQVAVESDKERRGALRAARQEVERARVELERRSARCGTGG